MWKYTMNRNCKKQNTFPLLRDLKPSRNSKCEPTGRCELALRRRDWRGRRKRGKKLRKELLESGTSEKRSLKITLLEIPFNDSLRTHSTVPFLGNPSNLSIFRMHSIAEQLSYCSYGFLFWEPTQIVPFLEPTQLVIFFRNLSRILLELLLSIRAPDNSHFLSQLLFFFLGWPT